MSCFQRLTNQLSNSSNTELHSNEYIIKQVNKIPGLKSFTMNELGISMMNEQLFGGDQQGPPSYTKIKKLNLPVSSNLRKSLCVISSMDKVKPNTFPTIFTSDQFNEYCGVYCQRPATTRPATTGTVKKWSKESIIVCACVSGFLFILVVILSILLIEKRRRV